MITLQQLRENHLKVIRGKTHYVTSVNQADKKVIFLYLPYKNTFNAEPFLNNRALFINQPLTVHYYYYPMLYRGRIGTRRFNIVDKMTRESKYTTLQKGGKDYGMIRPYPGKRLLPTIQKSIYYDISKNLNIYESLSSRFNIDKKMELFWEYIDTLIHPTELNHYTDRIVVLRLEDWTLKEKPKYTKDSINHPIVMFYFSLYRKLELVKNYDIDFFITAGNLFTLYFNPSKCDEKSYQLLLREIKRMMSLAHISDPVDVLDEKQLNDDYDKTKQAEEIVYSVIQQKETNAFTANTVDIESEETPVVSDELPTIKGYQNTSDDPTEEEEDVEELIEDLVKKQKPIATSIDDDVKAKEEEEKARKEEEKLLQSIYNKTMRVRKPERQLTPREKELKQKQEKLKIDGITIEDLKKIDSKSIKIEERDVSNAVRTSNPHMTKVRFANFDQDYDKHLLPKDLARTFTMFENKSLPLYLKDVKKEDTSDELNYRDTYTLIMEDSNRKQQTIKFDIPKIIEGKFLYVGGNKKIVTKQNFLFPVIKSGPDTVQIVTNTNKMFIRRTEKRSLSPIERLSKLVKSKPDQMLTLLTRGNMTKSNEDVITTIEYDSLAAIYQKYESADKKTFILFGQKEAEDYRNKHNIASKEGSLFVGMDKGEPIYLNHQTQTDDKGRNLLDIMYETFPEDIQKLYSRIKAPKRIMYAKVTTMEQDVPVGILLSFWTGFTDVLGRAKIEYELTDKRPTTLPSDRAVIPFKDCYMIYKTTVPAMMLLGGFSNMGTEQYNIADMDTESPYLVYIKKIYGRAIIANSLMNAYEFTIDVITEEILQDLDLPTNIVDLMLYAIELLCDNHAIPEIEQSQSRVRCMEIIPAILYYNLSRAYTNYKNSSGKKKISVPRDCVIKDIMGLKTVEDASVLNPFLEVERNHNVSTKGWRGVNMDRAYTPERRSYVDSMVGIIAPSSSPDANVGLTRCLSLEPKIKSLRGYCDITPGTDLKTKLNEANLFSPTELLLPFATTRDDPTRMGHMVKQSKHVLPTVKSSPVLISNGTEEVVRFHLSSDFVMNAEQDGEVVEKDEETGIMMIKYKDGSYKAVDLKPKIVKNGGGGFFMSNKLITDLNVGDKIKENDTIAWHKEFFNHGSDKTTRLNVGTLAKVAVTGEYCTHEDATFITKKLSREMGSEMCFCMSVVIGKNANVDFAVKEGDHVSLGDTIIQFDTSYDEAELNMLLGNLSSDPRLKETIMADSKNNIKSKYAGTIERIQAYSTVDTSDMSPTLAKLVNSIYAQTKKRLKVLNKYDDSSSIVKCGLLIDSPVGKLDTNKFGVLCGEKVEEDSVVLKFYVKHLEPLEIGSKIANYSALKNTICEIIPEGYEPFSSFRPEEEVSSIISVNSILARMVPSIILCIAGNKCQVELKRKLRDIYNS